MKTIKTRTLEYLTDQWTDKQQICSDVGYLASCYTDTVSRILRKLTEEGIIEKNSNGKRGTQYRRATQSLSKLHNTIKLPTYNQSLF